MKVLRKLLSLLLAVMMTASVGVTMFAAEATPAQHTVTFDVRGIGETPDPIVVNDGDCFLYLRENGGNNPTAEGYVFNCWVTHLDFEPDELSMANTAAYLETPIREDMTLYAVWDKVVDHVEIETDKPVPGEVIGTKRYETPDYSRDYPWPRPNAAVVSEGVRICDDSWAEGAVNAIWLEYADDRESTFKGTFLEGKTYGVWMMLEPLFGYRFADSLSVTVNGEPLDAPQGADYNLAIITVPVLCGEEPQQDVLPESFAQMRGDDTRYYRGDTIRIPCGGEVYICFGTEPDADLIPVWDSQWVREFGFEIYDDPVVFEGEEDAECIYAYVSAQYAEVGCNATLSYSWYRPEDILGEDAVGVKNAVPVFSSTVRLEVTEAAPALLRGDTDGDGEVTILDATAIQRRLADIPTKAFFEQPADADEDGEVTILDATMIQQYLAGMPANDRIGQPLR